jgi:dipeptide transport system substrate-binding protein
MRKGEHELVQYGWSSDNGDPDNFLNLLLSCQGAVGGSNVSGYCDKSYDELVMSAKRSFVKSKRKELYQKALLKFQEDMPFIPIAHSNLFRVMRPEVDNYKIRKMDTESFYGVRLSTWK